MNYIINKNSTPYGSSFPSEFYQGVINPLKKRVITQNLNINTIFRDNYYSTQSTNFNMELPNRFTNILSMQLASLELPTTYYVISKQLGNNFFQIKLDIVKQSAIIIIPDGNYSSAAIIDYLNNYVTSGPLANTYFGYIYFTQNLSGSGNGSGQMVIGINSTYVPPASLTPLTTPFNFTVNFQSDNQGYADYSTTLPLKLGWLLGYREGVYANNSTYVSEGLMDLSGPKYFYLCINDYQDNVNNGFYGALNSSLLNKNIIAKITLQSSTFHVLLENNFNVVSSTREYFGQVDIAKLGIQLIDEFGRIVDLNNMDFSFCLTFKTIYDL